jgi:membrane protein YqaA with SNARE-associated domain
MVYLSLFAVAFGAATLLPLGSEALFLYDIEQGYSFFLLWLFASVGNTLGSMVNYWLGLKGEAYLERKGHLSTQKMDKAKGFFDKFGGMTLLLSWAPIIGDPLTFVAGVLRYNFKWFVLIVFVAKATRYAVIGFLLQSLSV